jgi:hypothetical protein
MRSPMMASTIALAMLAACTPSAGWNIVHTTIIDPSYRSNDVTITGAPMPVRIVGAAPDGSSQEDSFAALTLPGRLGSRPARAETSGDFRGMRLVFAYSPLPVTRICDVDTGSGGAVGSKAGVTEISAALCRGDKQITYGILETQAMGPSDAGFRKAVLQLLGAIMPPLNDHMVMMRQMGGL